MFDVPWLWIIGLLLYNAVVAVKLYWFASWYVWSFLFGGGVSLVYSYWTSFFYWYSSCVFSTDSKGNWPSFSTSSYSMETINFYFSLWEYERSFFVGSLISCLSWRIRFPWLLCWDGMIVVGFVFWGCGWEFSINSSSLNEILRFWLSIS